MNPEIVTKVEWKWVYGVCQSEYFGPIAIGLTVAVTIKIVVSFVLAWRKRRECEECKKQHEHH